MGEGLRMKKDGVELNTKKQGHFLRIKHYMVEKYRYWAILGEETCVVSLPKFVFFGRWGFRAGYTINIHAFFAR